MIGDVLASRDPQTIRRLVLLAVAQAELAWLLLLIVNLWSTVRLTLLPWAKIRRPCLI